LGLGIPKSLVRVGEKRILEWQLVDVIGPDDAVVLVVGYMADAVSRLAKRLRPNIEIIVNEEWAKTKTAASLSLGIRSVEGRCVSLDGDLLVHPDDLRRLVDSTIDIVGISDVLSVEPVFAEVDERNLCRSFSYETISRWEWTGLVNFSTTSVSAASGNVFEMIAHLLPVPTLSVRCVEVDTPEDLRNAAVVWSAVMKDILQRKAVHGFGKNSDLLAS
jgi:choline kinase